MDKSIIMKIQNKNEPFERRKIQVKFNGEAKTRQNPKGEHVEANSSEKSMKVKNSTLKNEEKFENKNSTNNIEENLEKNSESNTGTITESDEMDTIDTAEDVDKLDVVELEPEESLCLESKVSDMI